MNTNHWVGSLCLAVVIGIFIIGERTWYNFTALREKNAAILELIKGSGQLDDVFQDMIGFRRLCARRDPYPPVSQAISELGEVSSTRYPTPLRGPGTPSTHPPTAFLFAGPVAFLSPSSAGVIWVILCFALMYLTCLCYGIKWLAAAGLSIISVALLLPVAEAFAQITLFWTAGVALAYRYRTRRSFWAGIGIGAAAMTKWLPAGVIGYFVFQRKWRAVAGMLLIWLLAVAIIITLEPAAFARYLSVNRTESWLYIAASRNISLFTQAYIHFRIVGVTVAGIYIALLAWRNCNALFNPAQTPEYSFFFYSFLAVMLLPLCWNSSLLPLVPVMGYFVLKGRLPHIILAGLCLASMGLCDINLLGFIPRMPQGTSTLLIASVLFLIEPPDATKAALGGGERDADHYDTRK
jgi:hypothetical protein